MTGEFCRLRNSFRNESSFYEQKQNQPTYQLRRKALQ